MNLAPDDAGKIREFHKAASGLTHNFRDASGGTGGKQTWRQDPTPIQTPAKVSPAQALNPFSRRMTSGDVREGKAGSSKALRSPSSRPTQKRRKLDDHLPENVVSKFFDQDSAQRRRSQAAPSAPSSTSSHTAGANTDTIIIDGEDDAPATNDKRPTPIMSRTTSPDPMDLIAPDPPYFAFDQNKPSPMHQLSLSLEGTRKPPKDGPSTARLRNTMKLADARPSGSGSRLDGDGDDVEPARASPTLRPRTAQTAQAKASPERSNVKEKVAFFEGDRAPPHLNLRVLTRPSRKSAMKPKRPNVTPLPFREQLDIDATRPSGFFSGSKPSKGKAAASSVSIHLPLKEWSIGAVIPPQDIAPEPLFNLIWESEVLKVRHVNGSTLFELQVKSGSVDNVKYVDIKRTKIPEPLIQIHPSPMALVQNHTTRSFKPGSSDLDGLLTFKFDKSASGWDNDVYVGLVQKLVDALVVKDGKSILDGPAARAVWETVTRVHGHSSVLSDPEPMLVDIPKKSPSNPSSKPREQLRPHSDTTTTADTFVRRQSVRLSESRKPKRFSPKPDPDEVILGYRSGTGSLNITNGDVGRLKPGEFLNDTLIEFGLKLWLADLQESNPELASQVHVFNSFFYKKLSTKNPEDGYHSVRKWTTKFDIFEKKYIIVPINENLHWYLAIIYLPEYTLLPRPAQGTNVQARRSTRLVIDSVDTPQPKPAPGQSLSPDPDPPPDGHAAPVVSSELPDPETPRTDDQKSEIDVERMVESACISMDPAAKQVHGQAGPASPDTLVTHCPDSPALAYPQSSPRSPAARLSSSEPRGDESEQPNRRASAGGSEVDTIQKSGISPSNFYGRKRQEKGDNVTPPQLVDMDNCAPPEIEIEEDELMGNPESERDQVIAEPPRTYIYTFDSLASKHPQAVKRLSRYLLMEAHDKKQLAEDTLTEPKGMQALVPAQTNYCDCGIYLLHFAKTFMKDPRLSSGIIRNRSSPKKGRRVPHEHWDEASVGSYREELTARILSMSEEWKKKQRGGEQDSGTKNQNQTDATPAPQDQQQQQQQQQPPSRGDPTPTTASSRSGDETDSDIVVVTPQKEGPTPKGTRRDSGLAESRKKGPAERLR